MYGLTNFILFYILLNLNKLSDAEPITSGTNADKGEFPFQVSFQKISGNNKHFCGGSIVHETFVLTAAHCLPGSNFSDIRIVAGVTNLKQKLKNENIRRIVEVFRHPNYHKPLPKDNDIAIVKIDTPFKFDKFICKVTLASSTYQIPDAQKVYATGWGLEKASGVTPTDKLKKIKVYVLEHSQCVNKYKQKLRVANVEFCTVHDNYIDSGVCNGDSGGPVVMNKIILVGVIKGSFHGSPLYKIKPTCGSSKYPDIHTEISKFRDWIDPIIDENAS